MRKINELNHVLGQTSTQKNASLQQVKILNRRIEVQANQIDLLSDNLSVIDHELGELSTTTTQLSYDLQTLRHEYAQMIYEASKRNNSVNKLGFLFSAKSFNELAMRYQYLKQYTLARKVQVKQMEEIRNLLFAKQAGIQVKKKEQVEVLNARVSENQKLEGLKQKQSETVRQLSKQEQNLKEEIEENRRVLAKIDERITKIIEREIAESRRRAESRRVAREEKERVKREKEEKNRIKAEKEAFAKNIPPPAKKTPETLPTPPAEEKTTKNEIALDETEVTLASSFSRNKNRLPWPVRGFVSERFGTHEIMHKVYKINNGVDIQSQAGEAVKCVFDGTVLFIDNNTGKGLMVMIQHGDYFTIYHQLGTVSVSPGNKVKAQQVIGTVAAGRDGTSEINFQVWKNTQKLNPENWLIDR